MFVIYTALLSDIGKRSFCFDRAVSGQRSPQCTIARCNVPLHGTIKR